VASTRPGGRQDDEDNAVGRDDEFRSFFAHLLRPRTKLVVTLASEAALVSSCRRDYKRTSKDMMAERKTFRGFP
jgi:hypothetical protein